MRVEMKKYGKALVTRQSGREAYREVVAMMQCTADVLVFDFDGVDSISNSFADEVFGHLVMDVGMDSLRRVTTFVNIAPFWARVVRSAMDTREAQRLEPVTC